MKNEGWTLSDLAGELRAKGLDINEVPNEEIYKTLNCSSPSSAAAKIAFDNPQSFGSKLIRK